MKHRVCSVCSVFTSVLIQSANICHLPCASHGARLYTRNSPASLWTKLKGFVQLPSPQRERRSMYGTFDNDPLAYLKFGSRTYLKFHIPLTKVWNFQKYKEQVKIIGPYVPSLSSLRASLFCLLSKDDLRSICHIFCPFLGLRSLLSPVREFGSDADFFLFWNCPVITDFNGINARPKLEIQE